MRFFKLVQSSLFIKHKDETRERVSEFGAAAFPNDYYYYKVDRWRRRRRSTVGTHSWKKKKKRYSHTHTRASDSMKAVFSLVEEDEEERI